MRYLVGTFLLMLLAAAQSSILPAFRINSGQPDLIFLCVLAWSVRANWQESLFWAFVGGLCHDALSLLPLGVSSVPLLIGVYVIKSVETQLYSFNPLLLLPVVLIGTLIQHALIFVALGVFRGYAVDLLASVRYFTLPTLFYHLVLLLPVYVLVRLVQGRAPMTPPTGF